MYKIVFEYQDNDDNIKEYQYSETSSPIKAEQTLRGLRADANPRIKRAFIRTPRGEEYSARDGFASLYI
jgi:hypothetical protein